MWQLAQKPTEDHLSETIPLHVEAYSSIQMPVIDKVFESYSNFYNIDAGADRPSLHPAPSDSENQKPPTTVEQFQTTIEIQDGLECGGPRRVEYICEQVEQSRCQDEYISCDFIKPIGGLDHHIQSIVNQSTNCYEQIPIIDLTLISNELATAHSHESFKPEAKKQQTSVAKENKDFKKPRTRKNAVKAPREKKTKTKMLELWKARNLSVVSEWRCEPCDRMFYVERGLVQHNIHNHSGAKPYICNHCGKRYHNQEVMLNHQKNHAVENKPYKCVDCPRQYFHYADLKRHVDLHHGVTRHVCKYCGKAFGRSDHVRAHEKSHEIGTVKNKR